MTLKIEKRTRSLPTGTWNSWAATTDAPPYINTELVEYRAESDRIFKIEELTSNVEMDPATFEVTGDGVFDSIMRTLNVHMLAQYKAQRLKAENFATVYVGVVPTVLQESMKFIMQKDSLMKDIEVKQANIDVLEVQKDNLLKDLEVKDANIGLIIQQTANLLKEDALKDANLDLLIQQKDNLVKDNLVKDANISLLDRQKEGFDDNKYQKLFEAQMNAWALMFSSGLLSDKPQIISNDSASALYNALKP